MITKEIQIPISLRKQAETIFSQPRQAPEIWEEVDVSQAHLKLCLIGSDGILLPGLTQDDYHHVIVNAGRLRVFPRETIPKKLVFKNHGAHYDRATEVLFMPTWCFDEHFQPEVDPEQIFVVDMRAARTHYSNIVFPQLIPEYN